MIYVIFSFRKWLTNPVRKLSQSRLDKTILEKSNSEVLRKPEKKHGKFQGFKVRKFFIFLLVLSLFVYVCGCWDIGDGVWLELRVTLGLSDGTEALWLSHRISVPTGCPRMSPTHDDIIKWNNLPLYWPFVKGPGEFPAQWPVTRALKFSLICSWINNWVNNREAGDLRRHRGHYDVIVMWTDHSQLVMQQIPSNILMNHNLLWISDGQFYHILQGYFTGTGAIIRLPQCQWKNPEGHG